MTDWIHKIQTLGSRLREAALLNCSEGARDGILDLSDHLRNICFIQGPASGLIQTIVRSRNYQHSDEIAETAIVAESAIASKQDRYRIEGVFAYRCCNCGKPGHSSMKCYSRSKGVARVNPIVANGSAAVSQVTCSDAAREGTWHEIVGNLRKETKIMITVGCRETW